MPVEEQVVVIYAGANGYADAIPVGDVKRFEADLLDFMRGRYSSLLDEIRSTGELPDALKGAVEAFTQEFVPSETAVASGSDAD